MNASTTIICLIPVALALSACGDPCLPTVNADTLIIPPAEDCTPAGSSTTGDASSSTGDDATTTGDMCPVPPLDVLVCAAMPQVGGMWGPCGENLSCDPGSTCITGALGNACAPACDNCGCPNLGCFGGTCNAENACAPACVAIGDPCPVPGMICAPDAGACMWP